MSSENRNVSLLMTAWISVLGNGNNKVLAFTLVGSEHGGVNSDNQGQN
jgi:hypothetical protein